MMNASGAGGSAMNTAGGVLTELVLSGAARAINARQEGEDRTFNGVSTDSRTLQRGELFVALHGPHYDGHAFLGDAQSRGAAAAMVSRKVEVDLPRLVVDDTRLALGRLAAAWRAGFAIPVVGVTGSNGKTTVKEMLAAILGEAGPVLATRGNLNNDIGLPLTLLRLRREHRFAVIEMGASHAGEIAYLTGLTRPTVALVTNAGPAHLEGFGSLEGVARAKGELFANLPNDGVAVINADDPFAPLWRELAGKRRCVGFGLQAPAEVSAAWLGDATGTRLSVQHPDGIVEVSLKLPGRHNVMNALAAAAAALAAGADPAMIKHGLERMAPVKGRLETRAGGNGAAVIDDTYNANPLSLRAALEVLGLCRGDKVLVLGDMAELGADAEALHAQAGRQARELGVDRLYAVGPLSRAAADAFGAGGQHFPSEAELVAGLGPELRAGVTLLVKGSRSMHMERVVEAMVNYE